METNDLAREIPDQPWYNKDILVIILSGLIPFSVVFIIFGEILQSLWFDQYLFLNFTFVLLIVLSVLIVSGEVSIVERFNYNT